MITRWTGSDTDSIDVMSAILPANPETCKALNDYDTQCVSQSID